MSELVEKLDNNISEKTEEKTSTKKRYFNEYYTEEDYILNRKVTMLYGVTFLFLFFSIVMSEILSLVFDEGLLSPVQVIFHSIAFVGYVLTLRYVYKKQDYIEKKNVEVFKKQEKIDEAEKKRFT
jgi:hypothetical protein